MTAALEHDEQGREKYLATLLSLSEASVHRHFDPYEDIDWEGKDFVIHANDDRWVLPEHLDLLGGTEWYKSQSREVQMEIGQWRQANIAKAGLQFENLLMRGLLLWVSGLENGTPEGRYCTHEVIEEFNHTLMFQEMVNRVGIDVKGLPFYLRVTAPFIPLAAKLFPTFFFIMVLGGEEPIDHFQRSVLRDDYDPHPAMRRVMEIHIAEEARHISFAHEWLRQRVPAMPMVSRFAISLLLPVVMRMASAAIITPTAEFRRRFGAPRKVIKDAFSRGAAAKRERSEYFGDVRMLAHDIGLFNPVSRLVWRLCNVDGDTSRYRSEPRRRAPEKALSHDLWQTARHPSSV